MFGTLTACLLSVGIVTLCAYPFVVEGAAYKRLKDSVFSPVILVPGDGGSQLEAKLDKPKKVHIFCDKKTDDYFNLWLNPNLLVPGVLDCWVDNMRLVYNETTRKTSNSPGVDIRVPGFGNSSTVEWLDPSSRLPSSFRRFIMSNYYVDIVQALLKMGYKRGVNIRGAPYDYRKAPNEMQDYYEKFKNLVEETYETNSKVKVTVVCHSMGCPIMSYFLNQQKKSWKDKHIKALISLAGAWGGAVKAMKVIASGENLGIIIVSQTSLRVEQRTGPSLAYMLPSRVLWPHDEPVVYTQTRNYTVLDYEDFFNDMGYNTAYEMYKDTHKYAEAGLNPPEVEVHCIHGQKKITLERLDYTHKNSFPDRPKLLTGDGDGTVNVRSLRACSRWVGRQHEGVHYIPVDNLEHLEILSDRRVIEYITAVVRTWPRS